MRPEREEKAWETLSKQHSAGFAVRWYRLRATRN